MLVSIAALCLPLYVAYQFSPFLERNASIAKVLSSADYRDAESRVRESIEKAGQKKTVLREFPINELTSVQLEIRAEGEANGAVATPSAIQLKVRPDRAILWLGTIAVLMAVLATLLPSLNKLRIGSLHMDLEQSASGKSADDQGKAMQPLAKLTAVDLFAAEVESAAGRADSLFSRSTLLLSGGVIMAFIGVGIFYVTLPETRGDETLTSYWPKVVRPTGVLIFIESIAWFLLRQYRALVEDYKWFYRLYLKRANYLAAIRILETENVRPEDMFIAASLIQEDYSGRLKSGETTESLEVLRLPEESPVTEALRAFSAIKDKMKPEKNKETSEKEKIGT
jgi:hypothetical protein